MSEREQDLELLITLLEQENLLEKERAAFLSMLEGLTIGSEAWHQLTAKQRTWVKEAHERFNPTYVNLVSSGAVPRGREVASMVGPLPKKPPPMPKEPERPVRAERQPFRMTGLEEKDDG